MWERLGGSITGALSVPGDENDDRRIVVDFCAERVLCAGNIYFEHKNLYKDNRMARGKDRLER